MFACCDVVKPLWLLLESVISDLASAKFKLSSRAIIYSKFADHSVKEVNDVIKYFLALGKYCIWTLRNISKYERKIITLSLIMLFHSHVRVRILADLQRWGGGGGGRNSGPTWCHNKILADL